MQKKFLSFFLLLILSNRLSSQCVLTPLSLSERVESSYLIVEAIVGSKSSYWNDENTMIFTANELLISRVFKGQEYISSASLNLITTGGTVGDKAVKVDPELELESGEIGIFMLVFKNNEWVSESGPQGFIRIDKHNGVASDMFNTYPAFTIQNKIQELTGIPTVDVNSILTKITIPTKRAAPVINSISPTSLSAGIMAILTIKGLNFETTLDTNSVQFRNADDGGVSFIKALKKDYISWSDTMIRLIVRTKAGTGKIRVVVGGNGVANSNDTLKVSYAHLNVVLGDTIAYETRQIGMNANDGITWKMNQRFYDSTGARAAFIRSLERWRCGTYINWDTLGHVSYSAISLDGVNMCAWDTGGNMPSGVLAQCFSFWSGCNPGMKWFVNELDIRFRMRPTDATKWNYTTGNANGSQFHFESVATHELGHGHQMGHVINSAVVMHFSIANGQTKASLNTNDIDAGNYVINKSLTSVCGENSHNKLNSGNCAIVAPNSNFTMSKNQVCKSENVTFTDSSAGNISAYAWNFGIGASPSTANTKGPHTVQYSSGGNKTVTLTITTITGNTVKSKVLPVKNDSKMIPNFTYLASEKGKVVFTNTSNNDTSSLWDLGDGDSSTLKNPVHLYNAGGTYNVKLISSNSCNTDDSTQTIKIAWLNFYPEKTIACIDEPVTYFDSSDNLAATWTWTFTGATPSSANGKGPHQVVYNSPGNKSASLSISVSGGQNQTYLQNNVVNIGTDTFSKANFTYGYYGKNIVGFENLSKGSNLNFKWHFGDGDSSSEINPVHTYTNANNKTVKLVVSGDCGVDDTTIQLRDFTGVNHIVKSSAFVIFPNPASEHVSVVSEFNTNLNICITDLSGKILLTKLIKNGDKIDISTLANGSYLLKIKTEYNGETFILNINR